MPNWDGVRVYSRKNPSQYIVNAHDRWYYYDWGYRLHGPYETKEEAIAALKEEWEKYKRE